MCSINNRNKLEVYKYFIEIGAVNYIEAIRALKQKGVRLVSPGLGGHGIEPFLIAMRQSGQLQKVQEDSEGGIYAITEKGIREYEGRKEYAGVA